MTQGRRRPLEPGEASRLLSACEGPTASRDACLLWLAWSLALRQSQLRALQADALEPGVLRVELNGSCKRIFLAPPAERLLRRIFDVAPPPFGLGRRAYAHRMRRIAWSAGLSGLATWETLRRGGLLQLHRLHGCQVAGAVADAVGLNLPAELRWSSLLATCTVPALPWTEIRAGRPRLCGPFPRGPT